jgi:hypothetical protein
LALYKVTMAAQCKQLIRTFSGVKKTCNRWIEIILVRLIQLPVCKLYNAPVSYLYPTPAFIAPMQQTAKCKIVIQ